MFTVGRVLSQTKVANDLNDDNSSIQNLSLYDFGKKDNHWLYKEHLINMFIKYETVHTHSISWSFFTLDLLKAINFIVK